MKKVVTADLHSHEGFDPYFYVFETSLKFLEVQKHYTFVSTNQSLLRQMFFVFWQRPITQLRLH